MTRFKQFINHIHVCRYVNEFTIFSFSGTGQFLASQDDEFLENNCVDDPVRLCDFQLLENRIMKTVDSVYQVSENGFTEKCLICYKYYFLDILIILGVTLWKTCEKLDFSCLLSTKKFSNAYVYVPIFIFT